MRIGVDFGWQHDLRTAHAAQRNRRQTTFPPQAQNSGQLVKSYTRAELKTHTPTCCSVCFTVGTMANAIAVSCPSWPSLSLRRSSGGRRKICHHMSSLPVFFFFFCLVVCPRSLLLLLLSPMPPPPLPPPLAAACCCLLSCHTSRVVDFERFDFESHAACNLRVCGGILFILFQFRSSLSSH